MKHIYIIGHDNAFKIGYSNDPNARVKQIQTGNENKIELLWSMERNDAIKLETHLHRCFQKHRKNGEWFDRSNLSIERVVSESYMFVEHDW